MALGKIYITICGGKVVNVYSDISVGAVIIDLDNATEADMDNNDEMLGRLEDGELDEIFPNEKDSHPHTVASVLFERWAKDIRDMAKMIVYPDAESGGSFWWHHDITGTWVTSDDYEDALKAEITYLKSTVEVQ